MSREPEQRFSTLYFDCFTVKGEVPGSISVLRPLGEPLPSPSPAEVESNALILISLQLRSII
jgi:hypothetical protein